MGNFVAFFSYSSSPAFFLSSYSSFFFFFLVRVLVGVVLKGMEEKLEWEMRNGM